MASGTMRIANLLLLILGLGATYFLFRDAKTKPSRRSFRQRPPRYIAVSGCYISNDSLADLSFTFLLMTSSNLPKPALIAVPSTVFLRVLR